MKKISSNILSIINNNSNNTISLKDYLIGIMYNAMKYNKKEVISGSEFITIINDAFEVVPNNNFINQEEVTKEPPEIDERESNFELLRDVLLFQIYDLGCMEREKNLDNELNFFGMDSPNGNRWYNLNPSLYLECAMAWLENYYGRDMSIESISWKMFARFLEMGRLYE